MQFNYTALSGELSNLDVLLPDLEARLKYVQELFQQYNSTEDDLLSEEEKEQKFKCCQLILSTKTQLEAVLNNKHPDDQKDNQYLSQRDDLPRYEVPDYSIVDGYKEDVFESALPNNNGDDLASWIKDFLNEYFFIPNGEIQIPIIASFTLMNSLVAAHDDIYPRLWVYGSSGTGKTTLSSFIKYFYGGFGSLRVAYAQGTAGTAKGVRNTINPVAHLNSATIFHWENVTPEDLLSLLKEDYTMLLMTTRESANKGIMVANKEGGVDIYKVHTLWLMDSTSVWGTMGKEAEVRRRCLIIKTEKSNKTFPKLNKWSWKQAPFKHAALWTKERTEKEFYPILIQCRNLVLNDNFPFDGSDYDTYYLLLATGVFTGVWKTIEEGLDCCLKHRALHNTNVIQGSPLDTTVKTIIDRRIRIYKQEVAQWGKKDIPLAIDARRIPINHPDYGLKKEIAKIRGSVTQNELDSKVHEIMKSLGYVYKTDTTTDEVYYLNKDI